MDVLHLPMGVGFFIISCTGMIAFTKSARTWKINQYLKFENLGVNASITRLLHRVQQDEGGRGIDKLFSKDPELFNAAKDLLHRSSQRVVIMTGFPCMMDYNPPTETDGPLGALAIARAILRIDFSKEVKIIVDECNEEVMLAAACASDLQQEFGENFSLESFPGGAAFDESDRQRLESIAQWCDVAVAIERAGPNADFSYKTMRGKTMTHLLAPLEDIIMMRGHSDVYRSSTCSDSSITSEQRRFVSIGIGDGGNEVGMGKVYDKVKSSNIPNAADIACVVPTTHLIVASVSNWGGYALAAAVALLAWEQTVKDCESSSPLPEAEKETLLRRFITTFLPSDAVETRICERMVMAGARDGITGKNECYVDGMPLAKSLEVLGELRQIALKTRS